MADRTSAEIFGRIFNLLATDPSDQNQQLARQIMQISREYDFSPYQMYADEACLDNRVRPDRLEQFLFLDQPPVPFHQCQQQIKRFWCQ